ncbi:Uncharacterised protein [uncultured Blautia sp.]|nr:Uncharacterised protein [uncultured Blautia sp.]
MVLRSIRTVMAIRGMAMAAAAKNRYRNAPVGSAPRSGNWPWTNQRRVMLNSQEIRMPVKNGGTAMHSWSNTVPTASPTLLCPREAHSPRGMDTTAISAKLRRLRHRVIPTLGAISSHTGWL